MTTESVRCENSPVPLPVSSRSISFTGNSVTLTAEFTLRLPPGIGIPTRGIGIPTSHPVRVRRRRSTHRPHPPLTTPVLSYGPPVTRETSTTRRTEGGMSVEPVPDGTRRGFDPPTLSVVYPSSLVLGTTVVTGPPPPPLHNPPSHVGPSTNDFHLPDPRTPVQTLLSVSHPPLGRRDGSQRPRVGWAQHDGWLETVTPREGVGRWGSPQGPPPSLPPTDVELDGTI